MAEKRTIFNEGTDPGEEPVEDPVIDEGRKISKLPAAPLDADGMATPELEDGEMAIAADVPPGEEGGKLTYKIKLSDVITNAKSEFEEYNVKNILAGTYIDDVTETPVDSGNWTINAEKQRMDPGTFVESLNEVKGDVTLTSTDESIVIEPEEVLNEETNELEYTGLIDLSLNTTTSSLYRAWVEVTLENIDNSTFDFEDEKLTKDNSVVSVNGVVLDGDQYNLAAGVVTILGVDEIPLKVGDVIGVISFVAETPNSLFQSPTYGLRTDNISIVGEDPAGTPQPKAVVQNNLQTQQDVNWYLLRTIENLDIPDEFDPEGLVTEDQLEESIEPLASREWVLDQSYITEQPLTDAIDKVVQDQLEVDQRQDHEIQLLETRVSQIESVSLDARYVFEGDGSLPRGGEFTILNGSEVAESWTEANGLTFNEEALEGKPEWDKVTVGDVIRLGGSTASGIAPTLSREADSFAEFKVTAIVGPSTFTVELIRSASHPIPGVEYGVLLLSSFDPSGLCTTEFCIEVSQQTLDASKQYTDNKLVDYLNLSSSSVQTVTGSVSFAYNGTTENKIRVGNKNYTSFFIPGSGHAAYFRGSVYANALEENDTTNHGGKRLATETYVDDADEATLNSAKKYTDDSLGTIPDVSEPDVDKAYVDAELAKKVGNSGEQVLPTSYWKIRARKTADDGNYSYIAIENDHLKLYHVADPTNDAHGLSRGYADRRYQLAQEPLVIKTTGSMACSLSKTPDSKKFCGLYNSAPGSSTNANEWFGNWNAGIRVNIDGMKTPDGEEFAANQKYIFNGYITVVGYNNGKVYFKHAIDMISRTGSNSYLDIHFSSRVSTYATGKYDAEDKYVVTIEGYRNKSVTTRNIPEDEIE